MHGHVNTKKKRDEFNSNCGPTHEFTTPPVKKRKKKRQGEFPVSLTPGKLSNGESCPMENRDRARVDDRDPRVEDPRVGNNGGHYYAVTGPRNEGAGDLPTISGPRRSIKKRTISNWNDGRRKPRSRSFQQEWPLPNDQQRSFQQRLPGFGETMVPRFSGHETSDGTVEPGNLSPNNNLRLVCAQENSELRHHSDQSDPLPPIGDFQQHGDARAQNYEEYEELPFFQNREPVPPDVVDSQGWSSRVNPDVVDNGLYGHTNSFANPEANFRTIQHELTNRIQQQNHDSSGFFHGVRSNHQGFRASNPSTSINQVLKQQRRQPDRRDRAQRGARAQRDRGARDRPDSELDTIDTNRPGIPDFGTRTHHLEGLEELESPPEFSSTPTRFESTIPIYPSNICGSDSWCFESMETVDDHEGTGFLIVW